MKNNTHFQRSVDTKKKENTQMSHLSPHAGLRSCINASSLWQSPADRPSVREEPSGDSSYAAGRAVRSVSAAQRAGLAAAPGGRGHERATVETGSGTSLARSAGGLPVSLAA